jgi:predicted O-linked N-acetylglucosamine transferase (SPINDLY family)
MATLAEAISIAQQHFQAGRLDLAAEICARVIRAEPGHAGARELLLAIERRRAAESASGAMRQSIALVGQGRLDEAIAGFRQAAALDPASAAAWYNLAYALTLQGTLDEAVTCYREAIQRKPNYLEARFNLANALHELGRLAEAVACYREALRIRPDYPGTHLNLGNVLSELGQYDDAVACYRQALALDANVFEAHSALGNALRNRGQLAEAVACYGRALTLAPDSPEVLNNLAVALKAQGNLQEAEDCCRRALQRKPDGAEILNTLGNVLSRQGNLDQAVEAYRRALAVNPQHRETQNNLAEAMKDLGLIDEAVAGYRRVLELRPDHAHARSNLLLTLQYRAQITPEALAAEHAQYERRHASPLRTAWKPHANPRDPERRLRLGLVSPDLGRHPVGRFLVRTVEHLDPAECELVGYSGRVFHDSITERFQAGSALWRETVGLTDEQVADQIRTDRIDILIDLSGHTGNNRLLVFARKPAPIQVTWIGYEGTTGLTAIDYLLADRHLIPPGAERFYAEQVLRLPDGYVCFEPPADAPAVGPLPAAQLGRVTFGSFNNPAKINAEVVDVWSQVLARVPGSRLVLKYHGLTSPSVRGRLTRRFAERGVDEDRLEFEGRSPYAEYLARYQQVDVALDPFPFGGGVTTCEALWMGVPVITCPGPTFASRHSMSHLHGVGLTEMIASNHTEYVDVAVSLAHDLPRLAAIRAGLRGQMAASPLCDGQRLAAGLMRLLRQAWRQWCERPVSGSAAP